MFKYIKEYRFYITLFLFILIPIISIDTSSRSPRDYRFYDKIIVTVTSPIQAVISWTLDSSIAAFQKYIYLFETKGENLKLLDENRKLLNIITNLREVKEENIRLRKLLNFQETYELRSVIARVIAKDVSTEFRAIRINRGENDGLKKDMPVINNEGVVGRVLRTTPHTADVVTVLDLLSAVDAIDKRSRVRGIVEGLTDEICQLKFALRTDDIRTGDLLISSGLGGIFPKGIPVGTVSEVHRMQFGITQSVEVIPSVDFSRLEEVLILTEQQESPFHLTTNKILNQSFSPPEKKEESAQ